MVDEIQRRKTLFRERAPYNPNREVEIYREPAPYNPNRENAVYPLMNNAIVNTIKEGYQQVKPYLPDVDIGNKSIEYEYERPMGPGIFSLGGEYDIDDNEYGLDFGYKFSFDDGGIATLAGDLEQRMTPPDPQQMDPKKLTDEQKDYLYDYMLDFMFKQKQREQMENEGRIPPFNYFNMEV
jgi:hypothetical protein